MPTTPEIDSETTDAPPQVDPEQDRPLNTAQAAVVGRVNEDTIRRWARQGKIEAVKRGRDYAISEQSLLTFTGQRKAGPPPGGGIYDPNWGPFTRDPFRAN